LVNIKEIDESNIIADMATNLGPNE